MISYREKELMMAMKYLADHTNEFADTVSSASERMSSEEKIKEFSNTLPDIYSYDDLVSLARVYGYDTSIRIEDLLTPEEIEELDKEYKSIESEFRKQTGLNKSDTLFIIIAVVLQMIRQVLQPKVNFDAFKGKADRPSHNETADYAKKHDYDSEKAQKLKEDATRDSTKDSRYYHASLAEIADISHVPYDIVAGTRRFGVKLSGTNHRAKTLGHDPWLGYLFGTCNILTNTMSLGKDNAFRTLHIGKSPSGTTEAIAEANAVKMVERSIERFKESRSTVGLAVIKQAYHIKSDEYSKDGLPLPFLQLLMDSEIIQELCDSGIDFSKLEFFGTIGEQAILAEVISYIIAVAHRISIICEENKKNNSENKITVEDLLKSLKKKKSITEVRTRKVILISESIASIANAAIIGGVEIVAVHTENTELSKKALEYIDLGGYLSTIIHLFADLRFITKIKKEYIAKSIEENYKEKFDAISNQAKN